jgi:hypothetical protein
MRVYVTAVGLGRTSSVATENADAAVAALLNRV